MGIYIKVQLGRHLYSVDVINPHLTLVGLAKAESLCLMNSVITEASTYLFAFYFRFSSTKMTPQQTLTLTPFSFVAFLEVLRQQHNVFALLKGRTDCDKLVEEAPLI